MSGVPIKTATLIAYIPLDEDLAEEINRRINDDSVFALAGLSFNGNTQPTSPPAATNNMTTLPPTTVNINSPTKEVFLTSATGFAAIAGAVVACLALITCSIIACVYLRVKQHVRHQKAKRFVNPIQYCHNHNNYTHSRYFLRIFIVMNTQYYIHNYIRAGMIHTQLYSTMKENLKQSHLPSKNKIANVKIR